MNTPHFQPDIVISEPSLWQAGEAPAIPTYVEPCLPACAPPSHYDESPTQLRIELERKALNMVSDMLARIANLEENLLDIGQPADTQNECVNRVWNGIFHTNSKGQRLIRFLDVNGPNHLQYLMQSGEFDTSQNGGYVQRSLRKMGDTVSRIFMVHESIKSLDELYSHPDNVAVVDALNDSKRDRLLAELAQTKLDLDDYKKAARKDLAELEKRMSKLLS